MSQKGNDKCLPGMPPAKSHWFKVIRLISDMDSKKSNYLFIVKKKK